MPTRKKPDPRLQALRQRGALNPHPDKIRDELFRDGEFFDRRDLVQVKYEMLRRVQKERQPVSQAAAAFGFSRPSFYKAQGAFQQAGLPGLLPKKRGPKGARKLTGEVMDFVTAALAEDNQLDSRALARLIEQRFGLEVHPRSIERALERQEKKPR
jgi:transposase